MQGRAMDFEFGAANNGLGSLRKTWCSLVLSGVENTTTDLFAGKVVLTLWFTSTTEPWSRIVKAE